MPNAHVTTSPLRRENTSPWLLSAHTSPLKTFAQNLA
jgi:hypothetical protein